MPRQLPSLSAITSGIPVIAANSKNLLRASEAVADQGLYGPAVSLAVLALEEAIKARTLGSVVAANAIGRQSAFPDDVLREILYSSHVKRHAAGLFQHLAASKKDAYLKVMLEQTLTPDESADIVRIAKIFTAANSMKQSGFYADFQSSDESWASPSGTTEADFEAISEVANEFVDTTLEQAKNLLGEKDGNATEQQAAGRVQQEDS